MGIHSEYKTLYFVNVLISRCLIVLAILGSKTHFVPMMFPKFENPAFSHFNFFANTLSQASTLKDEVFSD